MAAPRVREGFCGAHIDVASLKRSRHTLTGCNILAKAEHMNPGGTFTPGPRVLTIVGSVKDRAALFMIESAERSGLLRAGGTVIEATAGLVLVANAKGYKCKFFVPDSTSMEKINLLKRLGAEVIVCPTVPYDNPQHFQRAAREYAEKTDNSYFTKQFWNESNAQAHYETTGPEIWHQTDGKVSAFICAAGTGGTIGGTSRFLKEKSNGEVKCFLMDPSASGIKYNITETGGIAMSEKTPEEKKLDKSSVLEGIGSSKLYLPLSSARLDGVITGPDSHAFEMAQWCLRHEGISIGPSAGLNVLGAIWLALLLGPDHTVVTILCDVGANYHSRDAAWLESKSIAVRPDVTAEQLVAAFDAAKNVKLALPNAFRKL